jgi:DNA-binding Xre family transcriptional regulator
MEKSRVTEYILTYMRENQITASELSEKTGIAEEKLCPDYKEPLLAEEFLRLCALLRLSPEEISREIHKKEVTD